jgi:hypothetical protein
MRILRIRIRNTAQRAKEKRLRIAGHILNDTKSIRNIMYWVPVGYTVLCPLNIDKQVVRLKSVKNLADKNILSRETCKPVKWRCLLLTLILVGSNSYLFF